MCQARLLNLGAGLASSSAVPTPLLDLWLYMQPCPDEEGSLTVSIVH